MSEVYNGQMLNRFTELMDDMQRIYKEVGAICKKNTIHLKCPVNVRNTSIAIWTTMLPTQ